MTDWDIEHLAGVRAVALDVDGTIAGGDHRVSPRTADAIRSLTSLDVPVILLTGRSRRNTLELAREVGITNLVAACNGAVVFDPVVDENVRVVTMAAADVEVLIDLHRDLDLELTWWTPDDIVVERDGLMRRQLMELNESEVEVASVEGIDPDQVVKMMLYSSPERLDAATAEILARAPHGTRSMDVFFEFVDPDANKWAALSYLLERLGVSADDVLGMGDGGNDVAWLSRIGHPIAMGNARDEVIGVTKHRTGHHAEDGAAEILEVAHDLIAAGRDAPRVR
ncbi:HAD family hydrolase [Cnuibacter physcomitrellae]|uniref:HAD family hydrolase n=1 Tax=Cnuibacter physcomitrellae TaxID=1619308 RepID=UPI002175D56B|nr:HAD family hydrolase [Cnuibacter physcomitrellae]MCS5496503.1 HAD family hydrolase [Cnuibacter physcomitrellae]